VAPAPPIPNASPGPEPLLMSAWGVKKDQILAPVWIESERYDIEAKVPPGAAKAQLSLLLQHLLQDRFKLTLHKDTKEFSVYELTVAKDGLKIKPSPVDPDFQPLADGTPLSSGTDKDGFPILLPGQRQAGRFGNGIIHSTYRMYPMPELVTALESMIDMATGASAFDALHVVDATGLTGKFDFKLEFAGEAVIPGRPAQATPADHTPADPGSSGPSLFTALEKQLGLKLEHRRQSLDVIIVDHAEKTPTEN